MDLAYIGDAQCESPKTLIARPVTIRERLQNRKDNLEVQLKNVNEAIQALDAAPETARVLDLISKV